MFILWLRVCEYVCACPMLLLCTHGFSLLLFPFSTVFLSPLFISLLLLCPNCKHIHSSFRFISIPAMINFCIWNICKFKRKSIVYLCTIKSLHVSHLFKKLYSLPFGPKIIVQLTFRIKWSETMEFIYRTEMADLPQKSYAHSFHILFCKFKSNEHNLNKWEHLHVFCLLNSAGKPHYQ